MQLQEVAKKLGCLLFVSACTIVQCSGMYNCTCGSTIVHVGISSHSTHLYLFLQDGSYQKWTLRYLRISGNMTRRQARLFVVRQA